MSAYPHQVDVYVRDDTATGRRAGVKPTAAKVATAVRCRIHEYKASTRAMYGREAMHISHAVHFRRAVKGDDGNVFALNNSHYLSFIDPDTAVVRVLNVSGYRRPSRRNIPYVAQCEENAT